MRAVSSIVTRRALPRSQRTSAETASAEQRKSHSGCLPCPLRLSSKTKQWQTESSAGPSPPSRSATRCLPSLSSHARTCFEMSTTAEDFSVAVARRRG
jgi:hypothetical protein